MHDFRFVFMTLFTVFEGHPYRMDAPESEMIFIFQIVKPTCNQPDLSSVYMAACLLYIRNTSFASLFGTDEIWLVSL